MHRRRNRKQTVKTTCHDWSSLMNRDISDKYTVREKEIGTLQEISETHTSNEEYEKNVRAHMYRATKRITIYSVSWD